MADNNIYNLCLDAGATFGPVTLEFRHEIVLTKAAVVGATSLEVSPLGTVYTANQVLEFGTAAVTVAQDTTLGSGTITVSDISSELLTGATAEGNPVDLSGQSARSKIRDAYAGTILADLTCLIATPANGQITIGSPSDSGIASNITPANFSQLAAIWALAPSLTRDQLRLFSPGKAPYVWDLETYDTSSPPIVKRRLGGQVAVRSEVTYDD